MAGQRVKIRVQILHVDLEVRRGLRTVDQHDCANGVCHLRNFFQRRDRAQRIGNMGDGDYFRALVEQFGVGIHVEFARVADGNHAQHCAGGITHHLPRHDVGMMLHFRNDNFIAGLEFAAAITKRNQVDCFRGATHENDFFILARVDELANLASCAFIGIGRALAQIVHTAMDVRIEMRVIVALGVDHRPGFLRGGGVVEIDQRLAVDQLF